MTVISLYVSAGQCRQTSCIISSINLHTLVEWWKRLTMHLVWLKYHLLKYPYGFCSFEFAGSTLCVKQFLIFVISVNYLLYDSNNPRKPSKKVFPSFFIKVPLTDSFKTHLLHNFYVRLWFAVFCLMPDPTKQKNNN